MRKRRRRYRQNPIEIHWPIAAVVGPLVTAYMAWGLNENKKCEETKDFCIGAAVPNWFLWTGLVLGGVATTAAIIHYTGQ